VGLRGWSAVWSCVRRVFRGFVGLKARDRAAVDKLVRSRMKQSEYGLRELAGRAFVFGWILAAHSARGTHLG
jgi:hypothetical protein